MPTTAGPVYYACKALEWLGPNAPFDTLLDHAMRDSHGEVDEELLKSALVSLTGVLQVLAITDPATREAFIAMLTTNVCCNCGNVTRSHCSCSEDD